MGKDPRGPCPPGAFHRAVEHQPGAIQPGLSIRQHAHPDQILFEGSDLQELTLTTLKVKASGC